MRKILIAILLVANVTLLLAVFNDYQPSARARAMSNAYVAVSDDANGIFYNPAGITLAKMSASVGMSQLSGQKFTELKTASFVYPLPKNFGTIGIGAKMFDVDFEDSALMSESHLTLAHGFSLMSDIHSSVKVGWSANAYSLTFDGFGKDTAYGLNIGAMATLHQRTRFGFAVNNINQPTMGEDDKHSLPRKLSMGISYTPYDQVTTSLEMKKDFAEDTEFMGGVELKLFEPLYIRAGVHQNPATWSAGASFRMVGVVIDYAFTQHTVLDATHYFNIGYEFKR
jgi:opacity protein-like surface antigen